MCALLLRAAVYALLGALAWPGADRADAAEMPAPKAIAGQVLLAPALGEAALQPGDRLVFKLYHPDAGVEKDVRYWILKAGDFAFPQAFSLAPTVDMTGNPRWQTYVLEVFTDRDRNVLHAAPGELHATTPAPVPLGTSGLSLTLQTP